MCIMTPHRNIYHNNETLFATFRWSGRRTLETKEQDVKEIWKSYPYE